MAKLSTFCELDLPRSSSSPPLSPRMREQAEAEPEAHMAESLSREGAHSPPATCESRQGSRAHSPLRDTGCHHLRDSISSFATADRGSHTSIQVPCLARTSRSLRRENVHNQSLPRSPRLCSLSGMASNAVTDNNTSVPRTSISSSNSIVQVPLNTGDDMTRPVTHYFGSSSRTLVGATTGGKAEDPRLSWRATLRTHHTDSMFSVLSAPSKIGRSTTQHYILTPPSITSLPYTTKEASFLDTKIRKKPSRRGICNTVTIMAVIFVILFLFAGYPISLHVAKQMKENEANFKSSTSTGS